jgi:hypothetical protein
MNTYGMKIEMKPVISASELEEAVKLATGEEIEDLCDVLWCGQYTNDCYKALYFEDDAGWYDEKPDCYSDEEWAEECERVRKANLVYQTLRKIFGSFYSTVLVDVSW